MIDADAGLVQAQQAPSFVGNISSPSLRTLQREGRRLENYHEVFSKRGEQLDIMSIFAGKMFRSFSVQPNSSCKFFLPFQLAQ